MTKTLHTMHVLLFPLRSAGQAGMGIPALNLTRCPEPVPAVPLAAAGAAGAPAAGSAQAKAQALAQAQAHGTRFGRALLAAFGELLPAASYLPLSVTACNTGPSWAPRRDYETNRLSRQVGLAHWEGCCGDAACISQASSSWHAEACRV